MDIRRLEEKREELASHLAGGYSPRIKLFSITGFIAELSESGDNNLIEAYLAEFVDEYLYLLKIYEPTGLPPSVTDEIMLALNNFIHSGISWDHIEAFKAVKENLALKLAELKNSLLKGERAIRERLYFPVLEYNSDQHGETGFLEFLDIKIYKSKNGAEDKFLIVPSGEKIEKRLDDQIRDAWAAALNFVRGKSLKTETHHEVVISFDKKYGEYVGSSLGLVLTIGFIEELLSYYRAREVVKIKSGTAITGGVDADGKVQPLPSSSVITKTEVAFYSTVNYLAVPKDNDSTAAEKLSELNKAYPQRRLKIIGIESIADLLDRRNLVEINKISAAKYVSKKLYKQKYHYIVILILLAAVGFFFAKNFNNDPASLEFENHILTVKNKYGNTLWSTHIDYPDYPPNIEQRNNRTARLFDINNDGRKEVILTEESLNELQNKQDLGRVACFDYKHKLLWQYVFHDTISTRIEKFTPFYGLKIFDINDKIKDPQLLLVGQQKDFYPSPLIKLRLRDGKQVGKIFWHPGGGSGGFIKDLRGDGRQEVVATAISNGLERCVFYSIDYDKLTGTAPTTADYTFYNRKTADFNCYTILPKTDLNAYFHERFNLLGNQPLLTYDGLIYFSLTAENLGGDNSPAIGYEFDKNYNLKQIIIGDKFRVMRDSLVAEGKIKGPYTETPAYHKYLRDQIKYWNGRSFVGITEYEKTKELHK